MIYREKVGETSIEYEGTPEEILDYMDLAAKRVADAIQAIVTLAVEQEELPEEVGINTEVKYH